MDGHYSNLELVRHDDTARAPERDYDAIAFELDGAALAPQVVTDETPQVVDDSSLPEARGQEEPAGKRTSSLHITNPALKWPWIVIALLVTVVVAIGVAFGVWGNRDHSSHNPSTVTSPPVSQNHTHQSPHNSSGLTSPLVGPTKQFILNDTSLAATFGTNGDRYLFFQDTTGLIRGMRYISTLNTWRASLNLGTSSSAKNYTPLAAVANGPGISVFYVSEMHNLETSLLNAGGLWYPDEILSKGNFSTAANTRSLSVCGTNETSEILIYCEDPTGNVSAISQPWTEYWINATSQESNSLWEFRNNPALISDGYSKTLYESLRTNTTLGAPFACGASWTGTSIGAVFYSPIFHSSEPQNLFTTIEYIIGPKNSPVDDSPGNFSDMPYIRGLRPVQDSSSITQSDIALFGRDYALWINQTRPTILDSDPSVLLPNNTFPFSRLASTTSPDFAYTYLYHQINGTTFAEEQWDSSMQTWTTTYLPVSY